jgi:hypothetical protein
VRHGHLPEREIMTGIGAVAVRCPRVRDRVGEGGGRIRFSSTIMFANTRAGRCEATAGARDCSPIGNSTTRSALLK